MLEVASSGLTNIVSPISREHVTVFGIHHADVTFNDPNCLVAQVPRLYADVTFNDPSGLVAHVSRH